MRFYVQIVLMFFCGALSLLPCSTIANEDYLANFFYDFFKINCMHPEKKYYFNTSLNSELKIDLEIPGLKVEGFNVEALKDHNSHSIPNGIPDLRKYSSCNTLLFLTPQQIKSGYKHKPKGKIDAGSSVEWAGFNELYPHTIGVVRLSEPGFSKDHKVAVIVQDIVCGPTCGHSLLIQFKFENRVWLLDKAFDLLVM